jgi:hypothetical protein
MKTADTNMYRPETSLYPPYPSRRIPAFCLTGETDIRPQPGVEPFESPPLPTLIARSGDSAGEWLGRPPCPLQEPGIRMQPMTDDDVHVALR